MLTGIHEFNEIYEEHKNLVLRVAYIYSGKNQEAAEDIMQDTFLKLYADFDRLSKGKVSSWLVKTAKNAALNYVKKHKREILTDDNTTLHREDRIEDSAEENCLKNDLGMQKAELHKRILDGLMKKNQKWYDAIILVYYMDIPQAEAAEMLGIKLNVLHSMLHRAKHWIQKIYGAEYEEMN